MEDWRKGPSEEALLATWRYLAECAWAQAVALCPGPQDTTNPAETGVASDTARFDSGAADTQ